MKVNAISVSRLCLAGALTILTAGYTRAAAIFSYGSGPNLCLTAPGYGDFPFCTIPNEVPLGSFSVPGINGSFTDPNFGGSIRVMTGSPYIHPYALPSPVSASNKYLLVRHRDNGRATMLNMSNATPAFDGVPYNGQLTVWHPTDDNVYYRINGLQILKHTLSTNSENVVADYTGRFSFINTGGSSDTSKDNWISFFAPNEHNVCAVDLNTGRTFCADYLAADPNNRVPYDFIDYSLITKGVDSVTGKRYVFLMAVPSFGAWSVNMSTGNLDFEYRGPEILEITHGNHDGICDPGEPYMSAPHADVWKIRTVSNT